MRLAASCLILGLLAAVAGCAHTGDAAARAHARSPALQHGEWRVATVDGSVPLPDAPITLRFGADGGLRGHAGCNGFSGSYGLAGDRMSTAGLASTQPEREPGIGPLATTRMACSSARIAEERRFLAALEQVNAFELRDDGVLILRTGDTPRIEARRR
ncbi:META domain-containing protein [Ideonella sp.]|uniref:META domain-containing protein n=1 Tax=Ideonella sp. TaxID=1929293 RepID=UPI002B481C48|nr:META domain-containing protein [Ideonella sp.]HJV68921.1 META domain-containing protein [Ideonella sp.]